MTSLIWLGGVIVASVSFILGRVFSQSEAILEEKRRIYEDFLKKCPVPSSAYAEWDADVEQQRLQLFQEILGPILFYASPSVSFALTQYFKLYDEADRVLNADSAPLSHEYKVLSRAHNNLILEMRRDAFGWSVFGHRGKARLPEQLSAKKGEEK